MATGFTEKESELDGQLAVIRNDLAMGRFDDKELDMLSSILSIFNGYVKVHGEENGGGDEGCLA